MLSLRQDSSELGSIATSQALEVQAIELVSPIASRNEKNGSLSAGIRHLLLCVLLIQGKCGWEFGCTSKLFYALVFT